MSRVSNPITASDDDIIILKKLSHGADVALALRAKIILNCLEMKRNKDVAHALSIDERSVALWKERFRKNGVSGLSRNHGGGKPVDIDIAVLDAAVKARAGGSGSWTISSLAKELRVSEHMVKASLTRQGIRRRRLHSWTMDTADEVISKYIDIRGLYLSGDTRAIIICSSSVLPESSSGLFTTKNRLLARDLAGSAEGITLADTLVAAQKHCARPFSGKFETAAAFLSDVIDDANVEGHAEWHVFLKSSQEFEAKGTTRTDIHIETFETDGSWLSQARGWIAGTYETSRLDQIARLFTAIEQFIAACGPDTEPFLWRKKSPGKACGPAASAAGGTALPDDQAVSRSVGNLVRRMDGDASDVQLGALLILRDKDGLSFSEAVSKAGLPSPGSFDFSSPETMGMSIGKAEAPILSFAREMEIQMLRLYIENVKKNKAD